MTDVLQKALNSYTDSVKCLEYAEHHKESEERELAHVDFKYAEEVLTTMLTNLERKANESPPRQKHR